MRRTHCLSDSTLYYTDAFKDTAKASFFSFTFVFLKVKEKKTRKKTLLTKYLQKLAMHSMFSIFFNFSF